MKYLILALSLSITALWAIEPISSPERLQQAAFQIPMQGRWQINAVNLPGLSSQARLELERFQVMSSDIQIRVDGQLRPDLKPNKRYFRGRIAGHPDSRVIVHIDEQGRAKGLVLKDQKIWLLDQVNGRFSGHRADEILLNQSMPPLDPRLNDAVPVPQNAKIQKEIAAITVPAYEYTAKVAIETDNEYRALFNSDAAAIQYATDLIAYASTIYEREIKTSLLISFIQIWNSTDPWVQTSTDQMLTELQNYWNTYNTNIDRTLVHMLSGKNLYGGIAYIGVLCNSSYGYGLTTSISGSFDINNPQVIWDIVAVTHEIGHNFGSEHTHDYCNIPNTAYPLPVDYCVSSTRCGTSGGTLPGPAGAGSGLIMSYCHLLSPGMSNISMTFGYPNGYQISPYHAYGNSPERVAEVMYSHVLNQAAYYPSCLVAYYQLSVTPPSNGSISSSDGKINCGSQCQYKYAKNSTVTLTATPDAGYSFAGWTGDCSGTNTTCTLTMSGNATVGAVFSTTSTYTLSVTPPSNGAIQSLDNKIDCGSIGNNLCSATYSAGSIVDLIAVPDFNYQFSNWTGDCSSATTDNCILNMDGNKTISANFSPVGNGALDIDGDGLAESTVDGLLIVRYLFGLRGNALLNGIDLSGCIRCDATSIEAYIQSLMP